MMNKNTVNKVTPLTEIFKGCLEILRRDENWPVDDSVFDNVTMRRSCLESGVALRC